MKEQHFILIEQLTRMADAFLISLLASFIRTLFYKGETFVRTVCNFFGGISLGVLVGYLLRKTSWGGDWHEIVIAISAMAGREVTGWIIKSVPTVAGWLLQSLRNLINQKSDGNDTHTG